MKFTLLRFIYRGLLTGMPMITYNPITKQPIHIPFTIQSHSTYINYKLNHEQVDILQEYINDYDDNIQIVPVNLLSNETNMSYYLSVNIYNCSSPIFFNQNVPMTRLEVNTYVKKWNFTTNEYEKGTLILDYTSSDLSMDPINLFKPKEFVSFKTNSSYFNMTSTSQNDQISFSLQYSQRAKNNNTYIHNDLIEYSDKIFYKNGIYDKLYYDTSLVNAKIEFPNLYVHNMFYYRNLSFCQPQHIFYFDNPINFVGGMWYNVFPHDL